MVDFAVSLDMLKAGALLAGGSEVEMEIATLSSCAELSSLYHRFPRRIGRGI